MDLRQFLLGTAVAVATAASGSVASAAIFTATYTGTVSYGYDGPGEFGTVGADLTGLAFTATYKFDTSLGYHDVVPGLYEQNYGGGAYGNVTPMLDATLNIGALTIHVPAAWYGNNITYNPGNNGYIFNTSYDYYVHNNSEFAYRYLENSLFTTTVPTTLTNGFSSSPSGQHAGQSGGSYQKQSSGNSTYAFFVTDRVTFSGGVPEPATWGLMLVGFGGLGAMLRRRRSVGVLAAG